jgi:hypothetical protein
MVNVLAEESLKVGNDNISTVMRGMIDTLEISIEWQSHIL